MAMAESHLLAEAMGMRVAALYVPEVVLVDDRAALQHDQRGTVRCLSCTSVAICWRTGAKS